MSALRSGGRMNPQYNWLGFVDGMLRFLGPAPIKMEKALVEPDARCCEKNEESSRRKCHLCGRPVCLRCRRLYRRDWICLTCRDAVLARTDAERGRARHVPLAVAGGLVAGMVSAYPLSFTVVQMELLWSLPAFLIGLLSGIGAYYASGRRRGACIQWSAAACALLSFLVMAYLCFFWGVQAQQDPTVAALTPWDSSALNSFVASRASAAGLFMLLPAAIAVGVAGLVPQARSDEVR